MKLKDSIPVEVLKKMDFSEYNNEMSKSLDMKTWTQEQFLEEWEGGHDCTAGPEDGCSVCAEAVRRGILSDYEPDYEPECDGNCAECEAKCQK